MPTLPKLSLPVGRLFSLALRQLLRDARSGELRVLFSAVLVAVTASTAIGFRISECISIGSNSQSCAHGVDGQHDEAGRSGHEQPEAHGHDGVDGRLPQAVDDA